MPSLAQHREHLVNQMTEEKIFFAGDSIDPQLEVFSRASKELFAKNRTGLNLTSKEVACDAGEDIFLARQMIYIQSKQANALFTANKSLSFVPVDTSVPAAVEQFSTLTWTQVGAAAFVTNYGTDFPSADVFVTETLNRLFSLGSSYRYSLMDLRRAAFQGIPLSSMRSDASRLAHATKIDEIVLAGDTTRSITGLSNNANVTVLTAGGGTVVGAWESASATTIKADLAAIESTVVFACADQAELMCDTLLLDDESYMILNTRPATTFSDKSILKSYLENSPYIRNIEPWVKLRNAGPASVRRAIAYKRHPDILDVKISSNYEQFAPQQHMMEWIVPTMSRLSGVVVYRPMGMLYIDGLSATTPAGL